MTTPTGLHAIIATALGDTEVVWADQNGPLPPKPFAAIRVSGTRPAAHPETGPVEEDGSAVVTEHRVLDVEVMTYGPGAYALAESLTLALRLQSVLFVASQENIGIGIIGQARRVPALLMSSQYEERGMVEFRAHVAASASDRLGVIEHVVIGGNGEDDIITSPGATTPAPVP